MFNRSSFRLSRFLGMELKNPMRAARKRRSVKDVGQLQQDDFGASFTVPEQYRSKSAPKQLMVKAKVKNVRDTQRQSAGLGDVDFMRAQQIDHGHGDRPQSTKEKHISDFMSERDLGLDFDTTRNSYADVRDEVQASKHEEIRQERYRQRHLELQTPTAKEYRTLFRQLLDDNTTDGAVKKIQQELVEQYGIYPAQRMRAYMMSDDSAFPDWVNELPPSQRDKVKFSNMGLTDFDEATRLRLARMPRDERETEWDRLRTAREYEEGREKPLSPTELRNVRQGRRQHIWLQKRRQRQVSAIRRLALKKPERFEAWPSSQVDYSQRLAVIAQHVEAGVETKGNWPLDREELARAKMRKAREEEEATFMKKPGSENGLLRKKGNLATALSILEDEEKPVKRISRKKYAHRVNNVVIGVSDEYGRNPRQLARFNSVRNRAMTERERSLQKELRNEPRVNASGSLGGKKRDGQRFWPNTMKRGAFGVGMPQGAFNNMNLGDGSR